MSRSSAEAAIGELVDYRFRPEELVQDKSIFGEALTRVRRALDVSRQGLGDHALVATSTIATYETQAREPSVEAIVGIAVACGVEPWSAAQHGRLLLDRRGMRATATGGAELFWVPGASLRKPRSGHQKSELVLLGLSGVAVALAGAAIANAIRRQDDQVGDLDVAERKLLSRARSATPLPAAIENGLYPLVEPRERKSLEHDLVEASKGLTEDALLALVAALRQQEREP